MSFSFNEDTYYCFSCGCKGDVIALVEQLHGTDFKGAIEIISTKTGVTLTEAGAQSMPRPPRVKRVPIELIKLRNEFRFLDQLLVLLTNVMCAIYRMLEHGRIDLSEFYTFEQQLDWELQEIDRELAILNYQKRHFKEV